MFTPAVRAEQVRDVSNVNCARYHGNYCPKFVRGVVGGVSSPQKNGKIA